MYIALFLLLFAAGIFVGLRGFRRTSYWQIVVGVVLILSPLLLSGLLNFWAEMLWFEAIGYPERFWTILLAKTGLALGGGVVGFVFVYLLLLPGRHLERKLPVRVAPFARWVGAIIGGVWSYASWETILKFVYGVSTDVNDPIFGIQTGFYLFSLPFYRSLHGLLLALSVVALAAAVLRASGLLERIAAGERPGEYYRPPALPDPHQLRTIAIPTAVALVVFAGGQLLSIFELMYSELGVITGPGWTDIYVRQPAYWAMIAASLLLAIALIAPSVRNRLQYRVERWNWARQWPAASLPVAAAGALVALSMVGLGIAPLLSQWLYVQPNEITVERPFILNNIAFTRMGFNLHNVEDRSFPYGEEFTAADADENENLLSEIRLWDWRALDAVYKQFQEIRLYYEFVDVDVDRYTIDGDYRQVMVAAREMNQNNLPAQSQTFVNRRFKYTHGYGITMAPVSEFTPEGLPNLLVRDIPPVSEYPAIEVERPEIYYGELTRSHVFANSEEAEFDYPKGEENVYIHYPGTGGVELKNLWRKFVFGWKFDGTRFVLSSYPRSSTRVMFHRQVHERVQTLAPFLEIDPDPYVVLVDGKLYWIIDAYTTSEYFPYSESFRWEEPIETRSNGRQWPASEGGTPFLAGNNYVRNSVKAVVDAFNGSVDFYVYDASDPIVRVWNRIFPDLLKPKEEMPQGLREHVRYPHAFLLAQGLVLAKYHMTDPVVFYNQEDLWVRATEKYYAEVIPVDPYYIMWKPPGSQDLEFTVMLPFTPKTRQVLIGWVAGLCDPENYGRMVVYQFPKEKRVLGTQQVDTKIDQDPVLSARLSLWDQRGSRVIRGNVLAIPIEDTLLYVEPIYLQAETAAYPELRIVALMHGDNLSYADNFKEALAGLVGGAQVSRAPAIEGAPTEVGARPVIDDAERAREAFESYLRLQAEGRFAEAARELERLQQALQRLAPAGETRSRVEP